jgi:Ca2+-transporting ATPase
VLAAHLAALAKYGVGPQTRAVTFSSLVFSQLLYAYACRSGPETQSPIPLFGSGPLNASVAASAALQALPLFVPPVQRLLGIAPLSWSDVPLVAGASLAPFLVKEFRRSRRP